MNKCCNSILFMCGILVFMFFSSLIANNPIQARTEEVFDSANGNLGLSLESPSEWTSGQLSGTIVSLDWKLNGLFASNFASKLFASQEEPVAFLAIVNAPPLANTAIPLAQTFGLISLALSQYVTINNDYDISLNDGSSGHYYDISVTLAQLQKVKAPIDRALDVRLITTQQQGKTYIVAYATDMGRMGEYEGIFYNLLSSIRFGSVGFGDASPDVQPQADEPAPAGPTGKTLSILEGSAVQGSQSYDPATLTVKKGDKITVTNKDTLPHTVTSGAGPADPNSAAQFDTSILEAGATAYIETTNMNPWEYPFYCAVHPYMLGKLVVQ